MEEGFENTTSVFAAEGTAAHELASYCLSNDQAPEDFLGFWVDTRAEDGQPLKDIDAAPDDAEENRWFEVTHDMVDAVTTYTDYVASLLKNVKDGDLSVEQRLDMSHLHPDIFGTGDVTVYSESAAHLDVCDYKHGKGHAVEVLDNPQLLLYAVGAARRYHNRPLKTMTLHVVQPRAPHPDGPIRKQSIDLFDLFEFADMIEQAAARTDVATLEAGETFGNQWYDEYLKAGDHCGFCRAQGPCPKARENALRVAQAEFGTIGEPIVVKDPAGLDADQTAAVLSEASQLKSWLKAVEEYAHTEACAGRMPTGHKLVAKRANRKWRDEDEAKFLLGLAGVKGDDLYEKKFKSPAKVETLMKKKPFAEWLEQVDLIGEECPIIKKSSGTNLVPVDDPRPAVKFDAASEFDAVE